MPAYLPEIVAAHRRSAAEDRRDPSALVASALESPVPASFLRALVEAGSATATDAGPGLAVVAEVKRRSPSKGALAAGLDPAAVAAAYAAGGAACLSVLTDAQYFGGSAEDLTRARDAAGLPVLRKDFTVCAADVCDARLMGAGAVLLIVAALSDAELTALHALALELDLAALVEVHTEAELGRALAIPELSLLGVNQRDLETFEVDTDRAVRLAQRIPGDVVALAESGIRGSDDARRLADAGFDAILVGESAVTAEDRGAAVAALCGHPVRPREGAHSRRPTRSARPSRPGPSTPSARPSGPGPSASPAPSAPPGRPAHASPAAR